MKRLASATRETVVVAVELAVQVAMASRLNRLVSLGVAGLRLAGAALIPAADLAAALELLRPVRADIVSALGLGDGAHPTIVLELWPKGLRPPDAATMPTELTAAAHPEVFVTDRAWSRRAAEGWRCAARGIIPAGARGC